MGDGAVNARSVEEGASVSIDVSAVSARSVEEAASVNMGESADGARSAESICQHEQQRHKCREGGGSVAKITGGSVVSVTSVEATRTCSLHLIDATMHLINTLHLMYLVHLMHLMLTQKCEYEVQKAESTLSCPSMKLQLIYLS